MALSIPSHRLSGRLVVAVMALLLILGGGGAAWYLWQDELQALLPGYSNNDPTLKPTQILRLPELTTELVFCSRDKQLFCRHGPNFSMWDAGHGKQLYFVTDPFADVQGRAIIDRWYRVRERKRMTNFTMQHMGWLLANNPVGTPFVLPVGGLPPGFLAKVAQQQRQRQACCLTRLAAAWANLPVTPIACPGALVLPPRQFDPFDRSDRATQVRTRGVTARFATDYQVLETTAGAKILAFGGVDVHWNLHEDVPKRPWTRADIFGPQKYAVHEMGTKVISFEQKTPRWMGAATTLAGSRSFISHGFSADGTRLLVSDQFQKYFLIQSDGQGGRFWFTPRGRFHGSRLHHRRMVQLLPDGQKVLLVETGDNVFILDVTNNKVGCRLKGLGAPLVWAASRNGIHVLAGTRHSPVMALWHTTSGAPLQNYTLPTGGFEYVAFSGDGERLIGGGDGLIRVWNVNTGRLLFELHGPKLPISSVALSYNGQSAAVAAAKEVWLWELP